MQRMQQLTQRGSHAAKKEKKRRRRTSAAVRTITTTTTTACTWCGRGVVCVEGVSINRGPIVPPKTTGLSPASQNSSIDPAPDPTPLSFHRHCSRYCCPHRCGWCCLAWTTTIGSTGPRKATEERRLGNILETTATKVAVGLDIVAAWKPAREERRVETCLSVRCLCDWGLSTSVLLTPPVWGILPH